MWRWRPCRKYLLGAALARTAANTFEFDGYRIDAGENVMVATTVPHFLAEHFPEPERFDIDRFGPERAEPRQRFAYVPFGLGEHRCLGAGSADLLMILIPLTAIHEAALTMMPRNYQIKRLPLPAMQTKSFRLSAAPARRPGESGPSPRPARPAVSAYG